MSEVKPRSPSTDPQFIDEVFPSELDYAEARWSEVYRRRGGAEEGNRRKIDRRSPTADNELVGLAFSGGGIRSATLNLGVAQALHRHGVLDHVDYMSTVSGGGYLGSAISTVMRDGGEFPFEKLDGPKESPYITWIRNHSNYLVQNGLLDFLRLFAIIFRGVLLNFLIFVPLLLLLALGLDFAYGGGNAAEGEAVQQYEKGILIRWAERDVALRDLKEKRDAGEVLTASEAGTLEHGVGLREAYKFTPWVAAFVLFFYLAYPVVIRVFKVLQHGVSTETGSESSVELRDWYELWFARCLAAIAISFALESLPILLHGFHLLKDERVLRDVAAGVAGGGSIVALTLLGRLMKVLKGVMQKLVLFFVGLLGFILPLLLVLYVAEGLVYEWADNLNVHYQGWWVFATILGLLFAGFAGIGAAAATAKRLEGTARLVVVGLASLVGLALPFCLLIYLRLDASDTTMARWILWGIVAVLTAFSAGSFVDWLWERWDPTRMKKFALRWIVIFACGIAACVATYLWLELSIPKGAGLDPAWLVFIVAVTLWIFTWASVDVNLTSVSGLYRDRLASAYLVGVDTDEARKTASLVDIDLEKIAIEQDLDLQKICQKGSIAPYHLVNTALNLQGSDDPGIRERYADFFVFSKNWVGGHRTGYTSTEHLEAVYPQMDLATAMAISAAAAAPNMGKGTGSLVALMALLNVRLGYWVPNPWWVKRWAEKVLEAGGDPSESTLPRRFSWRVPPRAFLNEMLSKLSEQDRWVNLSDGGHLENMATYELLRRRCKYIITGDAEADANQEFGGLADLKRFASIDLGIDIEIDLDDVRLNYAGCAEQHCALGIIHYPPLAPGDEPETGYLLYIKQSVTDDEDEVIREYRAKHPEFPHESTADQFFDEGQFESYRALGFHIGSCLFEPGSRLDFAQFKTWFKGLESRLRPTSRSDRTFLNRFREVLSLAAEKKASA